MTVHAKVIGQGKTPLILLHGWGRSLQALEPLGEALGAHYQVHLLDLPGFGKSPRPQEVWDSQDYAKAVLDYMDQHKLLEVFLAGHSFGGKVALRLSMAQPTRVKRLVIMAASGLRAKRSPKKRLRMLGIGALRGLVRRCDRLLGSDLFESRFVPSFASPDYLQAGPMRPILVKTLQEDLEPLLGNIQADTLILWGDNDQETPVDMAKRFQLQIPHSKLLLLPRKGHEPFQGGGAQLCAYHIRNFLQEGA